MRWILTVGFICIALSVFQHSDHSFWTAVEIAALFLWSLFGVWYNEEL